MDQKRTDTENLMSLQTLKRLPNYYNYLRGLKKTDIPYVASPLIAKELGLNEVQVRKDLAAVSKNPGIPRKGFEVSPLIDNIAECLGYHNNEDAVLVGAGKLGKALLSYHGFEGQGVRIAAAFDKDKNLFGTCVNSKKIYSLEDLPAMCRKLNIHIAVITVPMQEAQGVCDLLVESGILAIWNFAPTHLRAPKNVLIQNENLATQLALLSQHLTDNLQREEM